MASSEKLPRFLQGLHPPRPQKERKGCLLPYGLYSTGKGRDTGLPGRGKGGGDPPEGKGDDGGVCVWRTGPVCREQGSTWWEESRRDPRKQGCV